jgi:hypothetical protein
VFEETNIKLNEGDLVTDLFIPHPERTILSCSKHKGSFRGKLTHPSNGLTASHTV